MLRTKLIVLAFVVGILAAAAAEKLQKADRIPAPPTPEQVALIREGVALHDQRNFEAAIAKYKQVLAQNPWEVNALHELTLTYFESKDYQDALATARLGAQCKSPGLPGFYAMIGNALDELGSSSEAIETYKAAIKQNPGVATLHYNLAISLRRAGKQADAKSAVEKALQCDPTHASSHAILGAIYREMGYRIPSITAYSRFLVLEGESPRSTQIHPTLLGLLTQGAGKGKGPNDITIFMPDISKGRGDEGDFTVVEMMMSIMAGADLLTKPDEAKEPPKSAFEKVASLYASMGESLGSSKPKGGFAAVYYAPYFAEIVKHDYTEAFTAYAWKAGQLEGAADWAKANAAKVEAFLAWSKSYQWPAK